MKKQLLLISFIFSFLHFSYSQNPLVKQWDKRFGGSSGDVTYCFQQTADGGYILGGWSNSDSSADKTGHRRDTNCVTVCKSDFWIVRIDSLGHKKWDKTFGGTDQDYLYAVKQTTDGGFILGGYSLSDSSGDKTQNKWDPFSLGDYWIVKTDSLGNKQWDKDFGGIGDDQLNSLQQTSDGGYILGGSSYSNITGDKTQSSWGLADYWIVKIDSLGNKQWDKDFGGTSADGIYSLEQTADGGYILGGYSTSGIGGDKTQNTWGIADYWVIKIDSLANKQWDKDFGGPESDAFYSLQQTADGGYILGGYSNSDSSGDKTQNNWDTTGYSTDYWIVKIDSLGQKQWDKTFGGTWGDYLHQIIQTDDYGYLLSGDSESSLSGDKTEDNFSPYGESWLVKTDSAGNKQWDKTIFAPDINYYGSSIQSKDGCFVVANATAGGIGGYKTQNSRGSMDYWIIKFCDSTSTTSITQLPNTQLPFTIYPNPAGKELRIKNAGLRIKEIVIDDLCGRTVLKSPIYNLQSSINISTLSPGIYFLKAGNEVRKFVKE